VTTLAIVLAVLLAGGTVLLVALPFLREPVSADDRLDAPGVEEEQWRALVAERDRSLAALKELEFDHRTGKVGDDEYRELVGPFRQAAAVALRALDPDPRYGPGMTAFELPDTPAEPAPPPDEGTPLAPAPVPEPYPPPDEATIPSSQE
jgi:hypothetical protein